MLTPPSATFSAILLILETLPCSTVAHQSLQPWPPMHSAVIIMIHFSETGFYTIGSNPNVENNRSCNSSITVPVLQTAAKAIRHNVSSLTEVRNQGFEVQWIIDHSACSNVSALKGIVNITPITSDPSAFALISLILSDVQKVHRTMFFFLSKYML